MWIHTFIQCHQSYLLTEYNNKNFITRRRYLRIICISYKYLLRSVLVALEDDNSTILKFCLGSVSGDCSFFKYVIFQFTAIFFTANTNP